MTELPPDLSRLGDELARAAERRAIADRRRRERFGRLAVTGAAAVLAMAIAFPAAIDRAGGEGGTLLRSASARVTYVPNACDQPRGATFAAARPCASPGATDVAALDRRYARQ